MTEPLFLALEEVLAIHADQVERYGGDPRVRDTGLLQSAIAMPSAGSGGEYFHRDLFEMGAAYLFHLCRNHPFVDGNKRVATVAALVFLDLNGVTIEAPQDALTELVLSVAEGRTGKPEISGFLRRYAD